MNLDDLNIAVRERTLGELFDLAAQVIRRHVRALAVLALIGALPWMVVDLIVMAMMPKNSWHGLAWLVALMVAQAPLATAPITAYLGEAMFSDGPKVRQALATFRSRFGTLLILAILRGSIAAIPVMLFSNVGDGMPGLFLLFVLMFYPIHVLEVLLLERQPLRATLRRSNLLMSAWRAEAVTHLLVAAIAIVGGVLMSTVAVTEIANLLFWGSVSYDEWWEWYHPASSVLPTLLPWPIFAYLAVVRFLSYIDLRTRREGWEIELDLRRAGRRLDPVGDG
jgi:hypothetical protein